MFQETHTSVNVCGVIHGRLVRTFWWEAPEVLNIDLVAILGPVMLCCWDTSSRASVIPRLDLRISAPWFQAYKYYIYDLLSSISPAFWECGGLVRDMW